MIRAKSPYVEVDIGVQRGQVELESRHWLEIASQQRLCDAERLQPGKDFGYTRQDLDVAK